MSEPNKKPDSVPPHRVDGYNSQAAPVRAPQAAMFNKGAKHIREIEDACAQRRAHSDALANLKRPAKQSPLS
jgi:hypothetical protein